MEHKTDVFLSPFNSTNPVVPIAIPCKCDAVPLNVGFHLGLGFADYLNQTVDQALEVGRARFYVSGHFLVEISNVAHFVTDIKSFLCKRKNIPGSGPLRIMAGRTRNNDRLKETFSR